MTSNSCASTYATLCLYHHELTPDEITSSLGVSPTRTCLKDSKRIQRNGWFLNTRETIVSKNIEDHLNHLIEAIEDFKEQLHKFVLMGGEARIFCFWASKTENGGLVLSANLLKKIGELGTELHFDIWFDESSE